MHLSAESLSANSEVVARLGTFDVSFEPDQEPWFAIDGIEKPRQIASDGSGTFVLLP